MSRRVQRQGENIQFGNGTPFWSDNIDILFSNGEYLDFWITGDQTLEEALNAIVRFVVYICVILGVHFRELRYLKYIPLAFVFTYIVYKYKSTARGVVNGESVTGKLLSPSAEHFSQSKCTLPTRDNPFMNFTMGDYMNIDRKKFELVKKDPACNVKETVTESLQTEYFNNNLYRDTNDVFSKMNSQRQFFTMPWTTSIPDESGDFKNWLYKLDKTCKESGNCLRYEDVRAKAPIFPDASKNPVTQRNP